jgi:hypothetical protein
MERWRTSRRRAPGRAGVCQPGGRRPALAALLALALAAACAPPPAARPETRWLGPEAARRRLDLEIAYRQMQGFERDGERDGGRLASGALVAAALAARGEATGDDAARWAEGALAACRGLWAEHACQHAQLTVQRLALQYREALPATLLPALREAAAYAPSPPPGADQIADPWKFRETENQRALGIARSLVAQAAAGTPDPAAARGWADYAVAFLAAHERDGWYEADSAGYMAISIVALLHLADLAPREEVRRLAARQLDLLFARWAQNQVEGYPAGPKSRTYVQWALGAANTAWPAWAWLAGGFGRPEDLPFLDDPELAASAYRIPAPVLRLLVLRRRQPPYEVRERRSIALPGRRRLDTALASYATPDYVLGTAQSVGDLRLAVSGGQEILVTLYPEAEPFAPLYLWSRTRNASSERWKSWAADDLAVGDRNLALARLGVGGSSTGHVYLAAGWSRPEPAGDAVVARCGDTYVALRTIGDAGGGPGAWQVARAAWRFPAYYADPAFRRAWVAVPWRQPADVALEVGRRAEAGDFASWKRRAARSALGVQGGVLRFTASDGRRLSFLPGAWASAGGPGGSSEAPLRPEGYPLLGGPFLASGEPGRWSFAFGDVRLRFERLVTILAKGPGAVRYGSPV